MNRLRSGVAPAGIQRLLPMVGSRGLDQIAQGVCSLLIARWVGTGGFAFFAAIFILYALAGHIGDSGLMLAILRTPKDRRLAVQSVRRRLLANGVLSLVLCGIGVSLGGETGVVVAFAGITLLLGPTAYCGRAILQWQGRTKRLAVAESGGAVVLFLGTVLFVRSEDDLLLFAAIYCAKQIVEISLQGLPRAIFSRDGEPPATVHIWVGQGLTYLTANVDYVLVAWLLGDEALSVYAIGFRLASAFSSIVSAPLLRGAFVDLANSVKPQAEMDRLVKQIAYFGVIGIAGTCVVALGLPSFLGDEWVLTRTLTILLGLALPFRLLLGVVLALAMTRDLSRSVIGWELLRMVAMTAAILAFSTSVVAAAVAAAIANVLSVTWSYLRACARVGVRPSPTLQMMAFTTCAVGLTASTVL